MYACVIYLLFKMAANKICYKVTVVDNESYKVSQTEKKSQDTITKREGKAEEQKKTSGI